MDNEHPEDICVCGDYRKNHLNNGICLLNSLGHGIPLEIGDCFLFRLAYSYWLNYDIYD